MDDLTQNVYKPTESAFQRPEAATAGPSQGFGKFEFGRAFTLGMDAYTKYIGLGAGATFVWGMLVIVTYFLSVAVVGLFIFPVLYIGTSFLGYFMVRREADFSHIFR